MNPTVGVQKCLRVTARTGLEAGWLGDPIRPRHGPRDLLEVLRLAAAQEAPEFGKVESSLPAGGRLGRNRRRRQGLPPAKPKPSYQATKDHGRITAAWAWLRKDWSTAILAPATPVVTNSFSQPQKSRHRG